MTKPQTNDVGPIEDDEESRAPQPALPELDLPEYAGRRPSGMKTSVSGAGNRVYKPHTIDDRVVLVIEAKVSDAGHKRTKKDGLIYVEKYEVADVFEVDGETGEHLLTGLRTAYRLADDDRHGRQRLSDEGLPPMLGPVGWLDASGRVLLPDEVAEIRGELALDESARLEREEAAARAEEAAEEARLDREAVEALEAAREDQGE